MKANLGTYTKKDGSLRTMRFVRIPDLPEDFLSSQFKGTGKPRQLVEGYQLVWDLDKKGFRIFNQKTIVGEVKEFNIQNVDEFELIKDFE